MRNRGKPVLTFRLPPEPPAPVAAVQATFDDVANRYAALEGELEDALAAVEFVAPVWGLPTLARAVDRPRCQPNRRRATSLAPTKMNVTTTSSSVP